jgi:hypothetical protein
VHRLNRTEYGTRRYATCSICRWMSPISCPQTMRATDSTQSRACCVSRRHCRAVSVCGSAASAVSPVGSRYRRRAARVSHSPDDSQEDHVEGLPLGTRGGLLVPSTTSRRMPSTNSHSSFLRNIVGYMKGLEYEPSLRGFRSTASACSRAVGGEADNMALRTANYVGGRRTDRRASEDALSR